MANHAASSWMAHGQQEGLYMRQDWVHSASGGWVRAWAHLLTEFEDMQDNGLQRPGEHWKLSFVP